MTFNKIIFKQIPRTMFAHSFSMSNFQCTYPVVQNHLEFIYIEKGEVVRHNTDGTTQIIPVDSFLMRFQNLPLVVHSDEPLHQHYAVGVEMEYDICPITEKEIIDYTRLLQDGPVRRQQVAIVPDMMQINKENESLLHIFREIVRIQVMAEAGRDLRITGMFFDFLYQITKESIRKAFIGNENTKTSGSILHSRRAMRYIAENIDKRITLEELSVYLGICPSYLCTVFKDYTGQTVTEYINRLKISRVKELLIFKRMSLKESGKYVGITDINYLSRLFKQYTDMTAREFLITQSEMNDFDMDLYK